MRYGYAACLVHSKFQCVIHAVPGTHRIPRPTCVTHEEGVVSCARAGSRSVCCVVEHSFQALHVYMILVQ